MNNIFYHKYDVEVPIGCVGYHYWDNKFEKEYEPGFYSIFGFGKDKARSVVLPITKQIVDIRNQEVLTQDNISLRISALAEYKIIDGKKFINEFTPQPKEYIGYLGKSNEEVRNVIQIYLREYIFSFDSLKLSEGQNKLREINVNIFNKEFEKVGIEIVKVTIRDIGFPKKIQDLFAQKLEASIRSQTDLENARTAVATARALKNASQMISEDESTKFLYYLETITKISSKGHHTFHIGENSK